MRRLLVAYDGSDNSKRALQYVVDLARDTGMALQIHVVNVQHDRSSMASTSPRP